MSATVIPEPSAVEGPADLSMFLDNLESFAATQGGVGKLRELILNLAVRGKLVEQNDDDETASQLRIRVSQNRNRLTEKQASRKQKLVVPIDAEEQPFILPDNWAWLRLGELAEWATGSGFPKRYQGQSDKPVLFCKVSDMNLPGNEKFLKTSQNTIEYAAAKKIRAKIHRAGTVVFPKIGGAIATNKRRIVSKPTAIDNNCLGLVPFGLCESDWLYLLLTSIDFTRFQSGTSVPALSQGTLEKIVVGLPPLAEQRRIVAKVDELMSLCEKLESRQAEQAKLRERANRSCLAHLTISTSRRELNDAWKRINDHFEVLYDTPETLADLRQTILQLAVQGKLVPQDPSDEPADSLLERATTTRRQLLAEGNLPKRKALLLDQGPEPLFDTPPGWTWTHFDTIADIAGGVTKGRRLQGRETATYPYLRVANVQRWHLDLSVMKEIEIPVSELEKYQQFPVSAKPLGFCRFSFASVRDDLGGLVRFAWVHTLKEEYVTLYKARTPCTPTKFRRKFGDTSLATGSSSGFASGSRRSTTRDGRRVSLFRSPTV